MVSSRRTINPHLRPQGLIRQRQERRDAVQHREHVGLPALRGSCRAAAGERSRQRVAPRQPLLRGKGALDGGCRSGLQVLCYPACGLRLRLEVAQKLRCKSGQ